MQDSAESSLISGNVSSPRIRHPRRRHWGRLYATFRWLHVYISMASFLAILFFAITGITLNHPTWTLGTTETVQDFTGTFPEGWRNGQEVDWLLVTEFLRAEHGVGGMLRDYQLNEFEGLMSFRAPGYFVDVFIDPSTGGYAMSVVQMGAVGILNELHRGIDGDTAWRWLIDVAGVFLALLALTGIGLLLFLKKFRSPGLIVMAGGTALVFILVVRMLG